MSSARKLLSELDKRLKPLGFETCTIQDTLHGPWMKFPVHQYTWRLKRLGAPLSDAQGPSFVCCRTSLPVSDKSEKFREFKTWARECLTFSKQHPQNQE